MKQWMHIVIAIVALTLMTGATAITPMAAGGKPPTTSYVALPLKAVNTCVDACGSAPSNTNLEASKAYQLCVMECADVFHDINALYGASNLSDLFSDIKAGLENLQSQIDTIELTPGPQGEVGPIGPQGDAGTCEVTLEMYNGLLARVSALEAAQPCSSGATRSCYSGPEATLGVGVCAEGTQVCNGGVWGSCAGEITPTLELCNGLDDNCDGLVDNDCQNITCTAAELNSIETCMRAGGTAQECVLGTSTACSNAIMALLVCSMTDCGLTQSSTWDEMCAQKPCMYANCETQYNAVFGIPADGDGDGVDTLIDCNDNNASIVACVGTENCVYGTCVAPPECINGQTLQCGSTEGQCYSEMTCVNGMWGECTEVIGPEAETCDEIDNDCNGIPDDGVNLCPIGMACVRGRCEVPGDPCLGDADCTMGMYCDAFHCAVSLPAGEHCDRARMCMTNDCFNSYCI